MKKKTDLQHSVEQAMERYFSALEDSTPANLYNLVVNQIEIPLIEVVMNYAKGNQSKAAKWLGLSRNTLRKLISKHNIGCDNHETISM